MEHSLVFFFFCSFGVYRVTREFLTHMETSPSPVSSPRTRDTHTYHWAFSSGAITTCFYDLGLSRLGCEHPTFRLRSFVGPWKLFLYQVPVLHKTIFWIFFYMLKYFVTLIQIKKKSIYGVYFHLFRRKFCECPCTWTITRW